MPHIIDRIRDVHDPLISNLTRQESFNAQEKLALKEWIEREISRKRVVEITHEANTGCIFALSIDGQKKFEVTNDHQQAA